MRPVALAVFVLALATPARAEQVETACSPRPMPAALDWMPPLPLSRSSVAFSATAWQSPGRAWVVRAHRGRGDLVTLEIVRLLRRKACNDYDVESRWEAPLPAQDYRTLMQAAERLGIPRADAFSHDDPARDSEGIVLDGTMIELRLRRTGWEVRRDLNHYGKGGGAISALFHALVAKHVPADQRPGEGWRTLGRD
ncbi:MAG TPA: hypothetical protein VGB04_13215 [Allosphingosinicella sp.]|jgi:hypothetical protein